MENVEILVSFRYIELHLPISLKSLIICQSIIGLGNVGIIRCVLEVYTWSYRENNLKNIKSEKSEELDF